MTAITTALSERESFREIALLLKLAYTGGGVNMTIGFNEDGEADYDYNIGGPSRVVYVVHNQDDGYTFGNDFDYDDSKKWTESHIEELTDYLMDCNWEEDINGNEIEFK